MMIVRPINKSDHSALRELARKTGPGFTSLQDNDAQVKDKLTQALAAFLSSDSEPPAEALYLFLMEDLSNQQIVGICGIEASVGLTEPWYSYRVNMQVHASRELNVYNQLHTLTLSNDHTGCSELCTLFLLPEARKNKNGSLLSKSRFLFLAEFSQRFNPVIIAEMRGYFDQQGHSPFWDGLGSHFFTLDFTEADRLSAIDKAFISELMPKHAIYTNLLTKPAQEVISKTHRLTEPARKMLEDEGMNYSGHVDIFDGGPTLQGQLSELRAVKDSRYAHVEITEPEPTATSNSTGHIYLISNCEFANFRCCMTSLQQEPGHIISLSPTIAQALEVENGGTVRIVALYPAQRKTTISTDKNTSITESLALSLSSDPLKSTANEDPKS